MGMNRFIIIVGIFISVIFALYRIWLLPQMEVATGYAAKKMCSCHFLDGRHPDTIQQNDLNMPFIDRTRTYFNYRDSSVETRLFGLAAQTAQYKGHLGCVLIRGKDDYEHYLPQVVCCEKGELPVADSIYFDEKTMDQAVQYAFRKEHQTRSLLVLHEGKIIKEHYAEGFDSSSVFNGWSMTKSITATLTGLLLKQKKMSLNDTALFSQWTDDRRSISLKNFLQMESGLYFEEKYDEISTAVNMLFRSEKVADIPLSQSLIHTPGSEWNYSSGTSNMISEIIRNRINNDREYHRFPYDSLFCRIGMHSAVMETDESGTFVGSSFCYASTRDWAKFGLLYLQEGIWKEERLLDSNWVDFVRQPAANSKGLYGGHFWLNHEGAAFTHLSHDMFSCNGFQGQRIFIFPNRNLVVVRMGLSEHWDFEQLLLLIIQALPERNLQQNL
jgi:hypothetical protein